MSYSIATLLTRNLHDVFGENDPARRRAAVGEIFNQECPYEALAMKCPAEVYRPSTRVYQGLPDIDYPFHG